jgi:hypothetical protein
MLAVLPLVVLGCANENPSSDTGSGEIDAVDLRIDEADLGELGDDQFVLEGPDTIIDAGADVMVCLFGTYSGGDVGLHDVHTFQAKYGHHLQLMGTTTPAADVPDGTVMDCTGDGGQFQMADLEPVGVTNGGSVDGEEIGVSMPLPDGMAVELEDQQRYVMQSHYLNTSDQAIHVRDLAVLTTIPEEDVADDMWAAPLIFNRDDFAIPAGGDLSTDFSCTTENDWNFLYVLGHMHEWGTAFSIQRQDGETWTDFYAVPTWQAVYRDAPIIDYYPNDSMFVPAGTSFKTSCSWFNDTDEDIQFPHEMCVGVNIVYPQKTTVICDGNEQ